MDGELGTKRPHPVGTVLESLRDVPTDGAEGAPLAPLSPQRGESKAECLGADDRNPYGKLLARGVRGVSTLCGV